MRSFRSPFDGLGFTTARGGGFSPDFYVSNDGSDSDNGLSDATAWATIATAYSGTTSGVSIGLRAGQNHRRRSASSDHSNRSFGKYGAGDDPIFDARKHIPGATWVLETGSVYKTTITLDDASTPSGVTTSSLANFNAAVWLDETFLEWKTGGANIAANIASVAATPGSFTIHKTGSTVQDPRSDTSGTSYEIYVHLPDGSNPTGQAVSHASYGKAAGLQGGRHYGLVFKGGHGKDHTAIVSYSGTIPHLQDCSSLDFGEHGWVGPLNTTGCSFIGKPRPLMLAADRGRSRGGALNLFTTTARTSETLTHHNLTVKNAWVGLYGHGSGNQGYNQIDLTGTLTIENMTVAIRFDLPNATTRIPFNINGVKCSAVLDVSEIDSFASCDSAWEFTGGGTITFSTVNSGGATSQTLVGFTGTAPTCRFVGVTFIYGLTFVAFSRQYNLAIRSADLTHTTPVLELDDCTDATPDVRMKGKLPNLGGNQHKFHLWLKNGTTIGDIMDTASGTNYPAELTVEAGCTFGMGDRTGPQIETALAGAGIPFSISGNTTIVNRAGTVLSSPGWK